MGVGHLDKTPGGRFRGIRPDLSGQFSQGGPGGAVIQGHIPPQKMMRVEPTEDEIGVGHGPGQTALPHEPGIEGLLFTPGG